MAMKWQKGISTFYKLEFFLFEQYQFERHHLAGVELHARLGGTLKPSNIILSLHFILTFYKVYRSPSQMFTYVLYGLICLFGYFSLSPLLWLPILNNGSIPATSFLRATKLVF